MKGQLIAVSGSVFTFLALLAALIPTLPGASVIYPYTLAIAFFLALILTVGKSMNEYANVTTLILLLIPLLALGGLITLSQSVIDAVIAIALIVELANIFAES